MTIRITHKIRPHEDVLAFVRMHMSSELVNDMYFDYIFSEKSSLDDFIADQYPDIWFRYKAYQAVLNHDE